MTFDYYTFISYTIYHLQILCHYTTHYIQWFLIPRMHTKWIKNNKFYLGILIITPNKSNHTPFIQGLSKRTKLHLSTSLYVYTTKENTYKQDHQKQALSIHILRTKIMHQHHVIWWRANTYNNRAYIQPTFIKWVHLDLHDRSKRSKKLT